MSKEDIQKWLKLTKECGYIDCGRLQGIDDEEFIFIISMAEELLKRV